MDQGREARVKEQALEEEKGAVEDEWVARDQVLDLRGIVFVLHAALLFPISAAFRATISIAQNVVRKWGGNDTNVNQNSIINMEGGGNDARWR